MSLYLAQFDYWTCFNPLDNLIRVESDLGHLPPLWSEHVAPAALRLMSSLYTSQLTHLTYSVWEPSLHWQFQLD